MIQLTAALPSLAGIAVPAITGSSAHGGGFADVLTALAAGAPVAAPAGSIPAVALVGTPSAIDLTDCLPGPMLQPVAADGSALPVGLPADDALRFMELADVPMPGLPVQTSAGVIARNTAAVATVTATALTPRTAALTTTAPAIALPAAPRTIIAAPLVAGPVTLPIAAAFVPPAVPVTEAVVRPAPTSSVEPMSDTALAVSLGDAVERPHGAVERHAAVRPDTHIASTRAETVGQPQLPVDQPDDLVADDMVADDAPAKDAPEEAAAAPVVAVAAAVSLLPQQATPVTAPLLIQPVASAPAAVVPVALDAGVRRTGYPAVTTAAETTALPTAGQATTAARMPTLAAGEAGDRSEPALPTDDATTAPVSDIATTVAVPSSAATGLVTVPLKAPAMAPADPSSSAPPVATVPPVTDVPTLPTMTIGRAMPPMAVAAPLPPAPAEQLAPVAAAAPTTPTVALAAPAPIMVAAPAATKRARAVASGPAVASVAAPLTAPVADRRLAAATVSSDKAPPLATGDATPIIADRPAGASARADTPGLAAVLPITRAVPATTRAPIEAPVAVGAAPVAAAPTIAVAAPSAIASSPAPQRGVAPDDVRPVAPLAPPAAIALAVPRQVDLPVTGTTAPAALVFAAAMRAAVRDERGVDRTAPDLSVPAMAGTPLAPLQQVVAATVDTRSGAPLDMRSENWPGAMIAQIERLRDAADAVDTSIRVVPDALGSIDVSVRREGDTVHVQFAAEQAATRQLLHDAQPKLAELAEARGLRLGGSGVDTPAGSGSGGSANAGAGTNTGTGAGSDGARQFMARRNTVAAPPARTVAEDAPATDSIRIA
jgi:flagellar hook-length control protein FliK